MHMLRSNKKDEENGALVNPFQSLDKTTVLQEARIFNETPIVARKCCHILTKLLYLLNQGESVGRTEATEAFFAVTKLWQSKDVTLRRLVYLAIKELSQMANDVIIVTSSLTKDMTGKEDIYRAAAIRALCRITDTNMLQAIERYMKQAIVDKVPSVSSAALVSSLHLMRQSPDVVRRWVNEVQEAVNSDSIMVQMHALGVLYNIRKTDRLAVNKLVQKLSKHGLKSPYAVCYLIRIACKLIDEDDAGPENPLFDFLESCLRHKCEIVIYEAASAIVNMRHISSKELQPAVNVLQLFCSSPRPSLRFAAVRTLNKVAMNHPAAVTCCNVDLENLIADQNRSIATLAITTLLKTGAEASIDRLMKQISGFVTEISDEFKIVVIEAIRSLCLRYPRKHTVMMNFLSTMLRDEGGFEFKKAIVDTIITIIEDNPDSKEMGLAYLCEFIEDCEHISLATRILHLLGREGPKSANPAKYIRFIYNRVILESATVRAAAITALAKFGAQCEDLLPNIKVLLGRCLLDSDDEVRDRAAYYLTILEQGSPSLNSQYILNGLQVSIVGLERALQAYCMEPQEKPFDLKVVPLAAHPIAAEDRKPNLPSVTEPMPLKKDEKIKATRQDVYAEQLAAIPLFASIGPLFKSNEPIELTEAETEYNVVCIKHAFHDHVVFQFDLRNTLTDQLLENVEVSMDPGAEGFEVKGTIPCPKLVYNQPSTTYTLVKLPEGDPAVTCTFTASLKFVVKDCDPATGEVDSDEGYPDEYVLEEVELGVSDFMQRVVKANFGAAWEELGEAHQLEDTYALSSVSSIEEAVKQVIKYLGMAVCERSDKVPDGKSAHALLLSGVFRGGHPALVRAKMALTQDAAVTLNFTIRSDDGDVSDVVSSVIG